MIFAAVKANSLFICVIVHAMTVKTMKQMGPAKVAMYWRSTNIIIVLLRLEMDIPVLRIHFSVASYVLLISFGQEIWT